MKKYTINKKDQQLINIFIEVGMPRSVAKILLYLSKVDNCIAQDIEHDTNLRQPEVSNATLQLDKLGMLKRTKKKITSGKGRPVFIYKLTSDVDTVFNYYKKQKQDEFDRFQRALRDYKKLYSNMKKQGS